MIYIFAGNKLMHDATRHAPNKAITNRSFGNGCWIAARPNNKQWHLVPIMERQYRATDVLR